MIMLVIASQSQHQGSNICYIRRWVVDKEGRGQWLGSVSPSFLQSFDTVGWLIGATFRL